MPLIPNWVKDILGWYANPDNYNASYDTSKQQPTRPAVIEDKGAKAAKALKLINDLEDDDDD